jgi:hypothetical protein
MDVSIEEVAAQQHAARCATPENIEGIQTTTRRVAGPPEGESNALKSDDLFNV